MRILIALTASLSALATLAPSQAHAQCKPAGITDLGANGCNAGFRYQRVDHRDGPWSYNGLRPGTKEWKFVKIAGPIPLEEHDLCGGFPDVKATLKLKHTGTDTTGYTLDAGMELSAEAKAGINAGIEASLAIKTSATFKAGTSTSSSESQEVERSWEVTFPSNSHLKVSGEAWAWEEKTVILDFRRSKQQRTYCCTNNDASCYAGDGDNPGAPWSHCDWITPVSKETTPGNKKILWMAKSIWERVKTCPCNAPAAPAPKQMDTGNGMTGMQFAIADAGVACPIDPPLPPDDFPPQTPPDGTGGDTYGIEMP